MSTVDPRLHFLAVTARDCQVNLWRSHRDLCPMCSGNSLTCPVGTTIWRAADNLMEWVEQHPAQEADDAAPPKPKDGAA